jgi:hypothetical protein
MVEKCIDQRSVQMPRGRVDHHARSLVHHQQMPVLINDLEGEGLGDGSGLGQGRDFHINSVPCRQGLCLAWLGVIPPHMPTFEKAHDASP